MPVINMSEEKRVCSICGKRLSTYNTKGVCFSAHGTKDGFDGIEREKFSSNFNHGRYVSIVQYQGIFIDE